jgi:hypothetical protein
MNGTETVRTQLLIATVPFVLAASAIQGVKRVALIGSLATTKADPKDVDLLLTVEETMDLEELATAGRKLRGRVTALTHANLGADLFLASPRHRYLGRLCQHKECFYRVSCEAAHCARRPYLRDDLHSVTLERALVVAPPLDLWPTIIARVAVPPDVEQHLLQPLMDQLGLPRSEQIIPHSVRDQLIRRNGTVDQMVLAALHEAAAFLEVALNEDVACSFIEIQPLEHYAPMLHFPEIQLRLTRLWVVELAGKTCFVVQGLQEGTVVFIAR